MTAAAARRALLFAVADDDSEDWPSKLSSAIDDYRVAVRAETLAPVTRGQSAELADVERWLRSGIPCPDRGPACNGCHRRADIAVGELDRLHAALAVAEAAALDEGEQRNEAISQVAVLEAENAELRKLCGRAAGFTSSESIHEELEAAARRAGK